MSALESSLAPIERYALRVRTDVDPYYSLYFRTEAQRREEIEAAGGDLDVDALEGGHSLLFFSLPSKNDEIHCLLSSSALVLGYGSFGMHKSFASFGVWRAGEGSDFLRRCFRDLSGHACLILHPDLLGV